VAFPSHDITTALGAKMLSNTPHVRYDVFLSSTWEDFKNTRPVITQALQKAGYVARGMEQFPAMNDEVFEYIKKVIDECSYYVVVSGSRYGSISEAHRRYRLFASCLKKASCG
jgi:hypothetical protein